MSLPPLPLSLKLLAGARILVGVSTWLFPYHASKIFARISLPPQSTIGMRLFGVRDATLAGLLITAGTPNERSRMVQAGVLVDGIDMLASLLGYGLGEQEADVSGMVGVGAAILVMLGLMGMTT